MQRFAALFLMFSSVAWAFAKEASFPKPQAAPEAMTAKDQTRTLLKDGTKLVLRIEDSISSDEAKAGRLVRFRVTVPVVQDERVIIADDALAYGNIVTAKKARSFNRGGEVKVKVDRVELVTGETAKLRGELARSQGNTTGWKVKSCFTGMGILALPFLPLDAMSRGFDVHIADGSRTEAFIDGDQPINSAAVEKAQALFAPKAEVGVLYIQRPISDNLDFDLGEFINAGTHALALLRAGESVRVELGPGTYWLSAQGINEFSKRDPRAVFPIEIEGGRKYYLRVSRYDGSMRSPTNAPSFELVDADTGIADFAAAERILERPAESIELADHGDAKALPPEKY